MHVRADKISFPVALAAAIQLPLLLHSVSGMTFTSSSLNTSRQTWVIYKENSPSKEEEGAISLECGSDD